jgi:glycosyltransferase involved in cell wall biosynthesis
MEQPLVSVIIGFYNEAAYLREAIISVLQQEYTAWELLLVDDGSTDASTTIAREFAAQYPGQVIYLEHPNHANRGVCASRNLGLQHAKANLFALLDADDVWRPFKLSQQVNIFRHFPDTDMVAEASEYWYTWNDPQKENVVIAVGAKQDHLFQPGELVHELYPLGKGAAPCPSGLMMKKNIALALGGFEELFTGKYQLYEDQAYLMKFYLHQRVYVSSLCNNLYRQRQGSVVQWVHNEGHYHHVRAFFFRWLKQYLQHQNVKDLTIHRLLHKALWRYEHPTLYKLAALAARIKLFIRKTAKR